MCLELGLGLGLGLVFDMMTSHLGVKNDFTPRCEKSHLGVKNQKIFKNFKNVKNDQKCQKSHLGVKNHT